MKGKYHKPLIDGTLQMFMLFVVYFKVIKWTLKRISHVIKLSSPWILFHITAYIGKGKKSTRIFPLYSFPLIVNRWLIMVAGEIDNRLSSLSRMMKTFVFYFVLVLLRPFVDFGSVTRTGRSALCASSFGQMDFLPNPNKISCIENLTLNVQTVVPFKI